MSSFAFPATFTPDETDGGFTVTFRDLPEAITQGDTREQCLLEAADCLEEAIAARIGDNLDIPIPSKAQPGEFTICVPLITALKAALYLVVKEAGITKVQLENWNLTSDAGITFNFNTMFVLPNGAKRMPDAS